mmetsp:Transcript_20758/g.29007  ORF Transcript_20758/g.29007 Transcript_20758/m.29007 type:complete len:94 (-) Transcript_20758:221-502(-)
MISFTCYLLARLVRLSLKAFSRRAEPRPQVEQESFPMETYLVMRPELFAPRQHHGVVSAKGDFFDEELLLTEEFYRLRLRAIACYRLQFISAA